MLSAFFAGADVDIERFSRWLRRVGPSRVLVWGVMLYGLYSLADCTLYVLAH